MRNNKSRLQKIVGIVLLLLVIAIALWIIFKPSLLNKPESIVYDSAANRFLISNAGNGKIISMDANGKYHVFASKGLKNSRGMKLIAPHLYVANNSQVQIIDLKTAKIVGSIPVPGAKMLNDIEADKQGLLYVTDTKTSKLHILDPETKKVQSSLTSNLMTSPNGIVYDRPRDQMFIVCRQESTGHFATNPILAFNIKTQEFIHFMPTTPNTKKQLDGIAIDDLGRIYYSSWSDKAIFRIPQEQNRILTWQTDLESPADFYYHAPTNEMLVPLMTKNEIRRIKVD